MKFPFDISFRSSLSGDYQLQLLPVIKQPESQTDNINLPDDKLIRAAITPLHQYAFFYVLLTLHLSIFILVINQRDAQNFVLE